jgi:hypothetical protein
MPMTVTRDTDVACSTVRGCWLLYVQLDWVSGLCAVCVL